MASETDICNLALAMLGDAANLQSIDPPDGSAQADHCARFYPIARDQLLELHDWSFTTRRAALSLLSLTSNQWAYCYAAPNDMINPIAVLDPNATDDASVGLAYNVPFGAVDGAAAVVDRGLYTPQPFALESDDSGAPIIWTNQQDALLRYTVRVTGSAQFSAGFVSALYPLLASMLAGPVLKGEAGARAATLAYKVYQANFGAAVASDANSRKSTIRDRQAVGWISAR